MEQTENRAITSNDGWELKMNKFKISVQIGFYSEPYEYYIVCAYDEQDALARVRSMLPKYVGHRFLNVCTN